MVYVCLVSLISVLISDTSYLESYLSQNEKQWCSVGSGNYIQPGRTSIWSQDSSERGRYLE